MRQNRKALQKCVREMRNSDQICQTLDIGKTVLIILSKLVKKICILYPCTYLVLSFYIVINQFGRNPVINSLESQLPNYFNLFRSGVISLSLDTIQLCSLIQSLHSTLNHKLNYKSPLNGQETTVQYSTGNSTVVLYIQQVAVFRYLYIWSDKMLHYIDCSEQFPSRAEKRKLGLSSQDSCGFFRI